MVAGYKINRQKSICFICTKTKNLKIIYGENIFSLCVSYKWLKYLDKFSKKYESLLVENF